MSKNIKKIALAIAIALLGWCSKEAIPQLMQTLENIEILK